ncbi:MAG: hypothetical protein OXU53_10555 [Deltaproteobacteria bacterium]|nr:hypothetical protein [Deltaproteobacteria bacterium]
MILVATVACVAPSGSVGILDVREDQVRMVWEGGLFGTFKETDKEEMDKRASEVCEDFSRRSVFRGERNLPAPEYGTRIERLYSCVEE